METQRVADGVVGVIDSIIARGADRDQYHGFWRVSSTDTAKPERSTPGSNRSLTSRGNDRRDRQVDRLEKAGRLTGGWTR
jgi:hypothetical protein